MAGALDQDELRRRETAVPGDGPANRVGGRAQIIVRDGLSLWASRRLRGRMLSALFTMPPATARAVCAKLSSSSAAFLSMGWRRLSGVSAIMKLSSEGVLRSRD